MHHSQSVLFPKFGPGRRDGLIVLYKVVHILFGYSIDVDGVPISSHDPANVLRVAFEAATKRNLSKRTELCKEDAVGTWSMP